MTITLRISNAFAVVFAFTAFSACKAQQPPAKPEAQVDHSTMTAAQHSAMHGGSADSSFAEMQKRGRMAMGVDQYASAHHFDITADGGRIELQANKFDSLDVAQIRAHMRLIQHAFEAGDFSTPAFVHMKDMPGTAVMARKRKAITYEYGELPRGAELRIKSADAEARKAVAEFMKAQRDEHHASGTSSNLQGVSLRL